MDQSKGDVFSLVILRWKQDIYPSGSSYNMLDLNGTNKIIIYEYFFHGPSRESRSGGVTEGTRAGKRTKNIRRRSALS